MPNRQKKRALGLALLIQALFFLSCACRPRDVAGQRLAPRELEDGLHYEYRGVSFTLPSSLAAEVRASSLADRNPDNPLPRRIFFEIGGDDGGSAMYLEVMKAADIEAANPRPAGWKAFRDFLDAPDPSEPDPAQLAGGASPIPVFPAVEARLASFGAYRRIEGYGARGFRFLPTFSQDGLGYRVATRDLGYSYEGIVKSKGGKDYFVCLAAHDCFAATPLDRSDPFPSGQAAAKEEGESDEGQRLGESSPLLPSYLRDLDNTLTDADKDGYAPPLSVFDSIASSVKVE